MRRDSGGKGSQTVNLRFCRQPENRRPGPSGQLHGVSRGLFSRGSAPNVSAKIGRRRMRPKRREARMKKVGAPEDAVDAARRAGALSVAFAAGDVIYRPGDAARGWIVLESGRVKVSLTADNGREVALYRIEAGESCLLTTSALLSDETMLAEAVAETDVKARLIPAPAFERLIEESAAFRRLVLRNYAERVADLVAVIQDTLFHAAPQRLARVLLGAARGGVVTTTHQALAAELGSAREVVSRILQRMEREGALSSGRGEIRILNEALLRATAGSER
jgi:CRP/FNR family transcriptional regulator